MASPLNDTSPTAVTQRTLLSTQTRLRSEQGTSEAAHRTSRGGGTGDRPAQARSGCPAAPLTRWRCRSQAAGRGLVAPRHHRGGALRPGHGGDAHHLGKHGALSKTDHAAPSPILQVRLRQVRKRALAPPAGRKRDVGLVTCEAMRASQRLAGVRKAFTESGAQGEKRPSGPGNNRGHATP